MSMRQMHVTDPIQITVTDRNGHRQGVVLAKHSNWCWVAWKDHTPPSSEHVDDLWICDEERVFDRLDTFVRAWFPSSKGCVASA